ncbi:hypothetical protein IIB50_02825 [Patescibacteria group bacterium]|nr:hypothetical protein [Patescibacteria group bacterium]
MDVFTLLIIGHLIGAVLGVGGATFIEIFLNKALRDGEIDPIEGSFLKTTFSVVRIGLIISIFTGIGFLLVYRFYDESFRLYDPTLWAKLTVIGVIVVNALLLQAHKIPIWLGSPLSFVSWYTVLALGVLLRGPAISYLAVMLYYVAALIVGGIILWGIRRSLGIRV